MKQSFVPIGTIIKTAPKLLERPNYTKNLVMLQTDRFLRRLFPRTKSGKANRIRQCSIRITDLCNLRCHTCGQWGDRGYLRDMPAKELNKHEVSPERYIELFHDLREHGHTPSMYIWGGEPMLYKGAVDVIMEAARLGMAPSIATNGTGIAENAESLVTAPMFAIQISVDGPDASTHNSCRPGVGSKVDNFAIINQAIDTIGRVKKERRQRLPLLVSLTVVNHLNYDRLTDIYELLKNRVDICIFYPGWWIDDESALQHTEDFQGRFGFKPRKHLGWIGNWQPTDYEKISSQLKQLDELKGRYSGATPMIIPSLKEPDELHRYYNDHSATFGFNRCLSIFSAVEIHANGDVSPCRDYHDFVVGNIKENTITELWNAELYRKFRKSLDQKGLMPVCTRCCGLMGY